MNLAQSATVEALERHRRILLFGEPGAGKSTLAARLARDLARKGRSCQCVSADPGSPAFGPPGAVGLAVWSDAQWQLEGLEPLCTLDAARYRLPLMRALERVMANAETDATLLIDPPGLIRGAAAAELLLSLCECAEVDAIMVLTRDDELPLSNELAASGARIYTVTASDEAKRPNKREREKYRTQQWNAFLSRAGEHTLDLRDVQVIGMPPTGEQWTGRQVALFADGHCCTMGEVMTIDESILHLRTCEPAERVDTLLVRDAVRTPRRGLHTAAGNLPSQHKLPAFTERASPLIVSVGPLSVTLVNGVFGDSLLQLRFKHLKRSMLFDLGDATRIPGRIAHQVSDVFITHAHFDHIAGFPWLLRARLGGFPPCHLYGPPGIARHIEHFIGGINWDRIGDDGPEFLISELHGDITKGYRIQVGHSLTQTDEAHSNDGVLLEEQGFRVRAITLDHGIPVLSFAFESANQLNIRRERLRERHLEPGPWLRALKEHLAQGDTDAHIQLPDGNTESVENLANDLVMVTPGRKLVYATDFADTSENRDALVRFSARADLLVCEATFTEDDAEQAKRTQHLTTRACGAIAAAADVERLLPFHFSKRYEHDPRQVYEELRATFPGTILT